MNKKDYYGGRKERFKSKKSNRFIDYNSFYNEPEEYLIKEEHHLKINQLKIKQVILRSSLSFAVLFLLSFLLYCIKHLIEGN